MEGGEIREAEAVAALCVEGFFGDERGQASDTWDEPLDNGGEVDQLRVTAAVKRYH